MGSEVFVCKFTAVGGEMLHDVTSTQRSEGGESSAVEPARQHEQHMQRS